jgi:peptidoglycan hydrolase CwlO-like protein
MEIEGIIDKLTKEKHDPAAKVEFLLHVITALNAQVNDLESRIIELESTVYDLRKEIS